MRVLSKDADWYRAFSLGERQALRGNAGEPTVDASADKSAQRRLRLWREQTPFQEDSWFLRRLRSEALDEVGFLTLLSEDAETIQERCEQSPEWLDRLCRALEGTHHGEPSPLPALPRHGGPMAFVRLFSPVLEDAGRRLARRAREIVEETAAPFVPEALVADLFTRQVPRLAGMLGRVVVLEMHVAKLEGDLDGDTPAERFEQFVKMLEDDEYRLKVLQEYPVLARAVTTFIGQWERRSIEFLEHFGRDWRQILETFSPGEDPGLLESAAMESGDRHRDGRTVVLLRFAKGLRLLYKPRSLSIDIHFASLLNWLAERGGPRLRAPITLDRGDYGWCEFIPVQGCADREGVGRFYERLGGFLGLLYILGATDFHNENLIACGEDPVLIDLESVLAPRILAYDESKAQSKAISEVLNSVLRVGILPQRWRGENNQPGLETSGIGGAAGQVTLKGLPRWQQVGTDDMRLAREKDEATPAKNQPKIEDADVDPRDYLASILRGFDHMARFLLAHRDAFLGPEGPVAAFADDSLRVILRHTRLYGVILYESFHPDVTRDALDRDRIFDRLWYGLEDDGEALEKLLALIPGEKEELWRGDIPYFSTRGSSRDLWTGNGERVADFFAASALEEVRDRLHRVTEGDLKRQEWYIRGAMTALTLETDPHLTRRHLTAAPAPAERGALLQAAREVGDTLQEVALRGDADATWIGLSRVPTRGWVVSPAGFDLYSGNAGIALFLAYLGEVTGESTYTETARAGLWETRRQIDEYGSQMGWIGGYGGWAGLIHAWTHFAALWGEESWRTEAEAMMERLPDLLLEDECLDVLAGAAGAIPPLLTLGRLTGNPRALEIARQMGEFLLGKALECPVGIGWGVDISPSLPLTGFSHGSAGFAWALAQLYKATADPRFRDAALKTLEYEDSLFSEERGNWPDLRPYSLMAQEDRPEIPTTFMHAWCHGAPGIGLGRLGCLGILEDPRIAEDLERAAATTFRDGFGGSHSLCHGDFGNVDLLLGKARSAIATPKDHQRLEQAVGNILHNRPAKGWLCGVPTGIETPGLMVGMAGIGYQLLRLAEPDRVPSVLTLEPPVGV